MVQGSARERILQPVNEQPVQIGAEEQRCWRLNDSKRKKRQMLSCKEKQKACVGTKCQSQHTT